MMQSLVSERPDAGERAVLVHMTFYRGKENLYELKELAKKESLCFSSLSRK